VLRLLYPRYLPRTYRSGPTVPFESGSCPAQSSPIGSCPAGCGSLGGNSRPEGSTAFEPPDVTIPCLEEAKVRGRDQAGASSRRSPSNGFHVAGVSRLDHCKGIESAWPGWACAGEKPLPLRRGLVDRRSRGGRGSGVRGQRRRRPERGRQCGDGGHRRRQGHRRRPPVCRRRRGRRAVGEVASVRVPEAGLPSTVGGGGGAME
jgi:hypothetical protein